MFIQPVSMVVGKTEYERDLKEELIKMGYKRTNISFKKSEFLMLRTHKTCLSAVTNLMLNYNKREHIEIYDPELFLAIAAMTDQIEGNYREYFVCMTDYLHGKKNELYTLEQIKPTNNGIGGLLNNNIYRKATSDELFYYLNTRIEEFPGLEYTRKEVLLRYGISINRFELRYSDRECPQCEKKFEK